MSDKQHVYVEYALNNITWAENVIKHYISYEALYDM